jgi:hypothetical protein
LPAVFSIDSALTGRAGAVAGNGNDAGAGAAGFAAAGLLVSETGRVGSYSTSALVAGGVVAGCVVTGCAVAGCAGAAACGTACAGVAAGFCALAWAHSATAMMVALNVALNVALKIVIKLEEIRAHSFIKTSRNGAGTESPIHIPPAARKVRFSQDW